jgi:hypothetical protein
LAVPVLSWVLTSPAHTGNVNSSKMAVKAKMKLRVSLVLRLKVDKVSLFFIVYYS